jgi:hypothetical protein
MTCTVNNLCVCVCVGVRIRLIKETNLCIIFQHFAIKILSVVRVSILHICRHMLKKKLRKVTFSFVMSVCLSVSSWSDSTPTWQIFMKVYIEDFSKIHLENSSSIKLDKNNRHSTWRIMYECDNISLNSS